MRVTTIVLMVVLVIVAGWAVYLFNLLKPEEAYHAIKDSAGSTPETFSVLVGEISSNLSEADAPADISFGYPEWRPTTISANVKFRKNGSQWTVVLVEHDHQRFSSMNEFLLREMNAYKAAYVAVQQRIAERVAQFWSAVEHRSVSGIVDLYSQSSSDSNYQRLLARLQPMASFPEDEIRRHMARLSDPDQVQTCRLALLFIGGNFEVLRSEHQRMLAEEVLSRFPVPVTEYKIRSIRRFGGDEYVQVEMSYSTQTGTNTIKQTYCNEDGKWVLFSQ